jgi:hypothetical protein
VPQLRFRERVVALEQIIEFYLLYVIVPLWLLAGTADWLCHRLSRIEEHTGLRESMIHAAMLAEGGTALLCGLFLEINAAVLAIFFACWILHEITAFSDLAIATAAREISPIEQHVHSYLLVLPFVALSFITILHWPQAAAVAGLAWERPDWTLRWKVEPLPIGYLVGLPLAVLVLNIGPYLEELWRCWRHTAPARIRLRFAQGHPAE